MFGKRSLKNKYDRVTDIVKSLSLNPNDRFKESLIHYNARITFKSLCIVLLNYDHYKHSQ
jgi:hypothetical protein